MKLEKLIKEVEKQLKKEEQKGRGKLNGLSKISQIKDKIPFVDRKIVFLPDKGQAIFVGDLHGELDKLEKILAQKNIFKSYLVFLGDYVDRGPKQIETLERVLELKLKSPQKVYLLRGNHEYKGGFSPHDFPYVAGKELYDIANKFFESLPYIVITKNGLCALHGGICQGIKKLENLTKLSRRQLNKIVWNDPIPRYSHAHESYESTRIKTQEFIFNYQRGIGNLFNQKALEEFLENIGAKILLRSHQYSYGGWGSLFDKKVITIFSASYQGLVKNPCYAVLDLESKEPRLKRKEIL